ncbi:flagellar basal body P-ring formation protein FlgA [Vibrio campbellii]|uniref:flagellar basal body P-ring formation chaperone FlgA n=1 Tax=Vibrio campbellii TaxID=680 RepID=UPI001D17701B|nr:flagellar basal body P-ring formation chaperone FlgA [Vibrio campbellii]MCC4224133.1 flagellar basal body P-ring formation protein FlgA [Vibrio campbellii]
MNYKQGRKPRFRFTETIQTKGKGQFPSIMLLCGLVLSASSLSVLANEKNLTADELKAIVGEQFEQEVAQVAHSRQWGAYQLDYQIWVPGSANHLPFCDTPLAIAGRDNRPLPVGNLKRAVSCEDVSSPWRINVTIKSAVTLPVLVATSTIGRNESISASNLKTETRTISRQDDFFTKANQAIGLETTRRIRAGQIIAPTNLSSPPLIEKGNEVIIIASKDGFSASTKGVALEQGKKGQQIEVENISSGKVIRAVVTGLNQVHTQF